SLMVGALVHNTPSPAAGMIRDAGLAEEVEKELLGHQSFALLTLVGGDDLPAVERTLLLYKLATGLCRQGGIGISRVYLGRVLPAALLREMFGRSPQPGAESIWDILRNHGEPPEMLVHFCRVELQGKVYLATCGFGYCGLPDLIWEYTSQQEAGEVSQ